MKTKNYIVFYIDDKKRLNLAGIYNNIDDAKARLDYVEKHFSFGKGEWELEGVPAIDIDFNSVMLLNYKED